MDVYNLGMVSWWESQCYYHALAYMGREGVIICRPAEPYVCLGLHDDLQQEIDLDFCEQAALPLLRRETGGGVVYLDDRQIFYQVVLHRSNPLLPMRRTNLFAAILQPAREVCRSLGIEAEMVPPADIQAAGKKCSGNGAGDIGEGVAYVGNLIIDFNFERMSRVLKVPSLLYRRCLCKAMEDNMLTLSPQMNGTNPGELESRLVEGFAKLFGGVRERLPDREMRSKALSIKDHLTSDEWLKMPGRRAGLRKIKIVEGVYLEESELGGKARIPRLIWDGKVEKAAPSMG
jgi:lipoate---protein ligase